MFIILLLNSTVCNICIHVNVKVPLFPNELQTTRSNQVNIKTKSYNYTYFKATSVVKKLI